MIQTILRDEIACILAALSSAGEQRDPDYQQALHDVAVAVGLRPPPGNGRGGYQVEVFDVRPSLTLLDR